MNGGFIHAMQNPAFFGLNFEIAIKSLADFKVFLVIFRAAAFARNAQGNRLDQIRELALAT